MSRRPAVVALLSAAVLALAVAPGASQPAAFRPSAIADAYLTPPRDRPIIPAPKSARWLDGRFEITASTRIIVGDAAEPEDLYAARELNEEIAAWGARPLEVVRVSAAGAPPGEAPRDVILIGEPALNPFAGAALAKDGHRVDRQSPGPEGYVLIVKTGIIVASGADRRGTFYAIQTLRQLLAADAAGAGSADRTRLTIPAVEIRDWPDHAIRAVHVVLDNYSSVFHVALIDRIFSRYKFNMLIAESEYVQWDSAPNIRHPSGATKAQAAAVIAAAREHLIEPVPLIQTLGHSGWLFHNDQNLDLLEMPVDLAPARFVYNPLNPRVYDVVLPILDEAVALFGARYVHIGHDEVRNVVPFPWSEEGKRLGFGELFVRDVLRLHEHLRQRGVGTMMWGDVLLTSDYAPELARLPKDIVVVDWQYHDAARYPSLRQLRDRGFPVLAATWFDFGNIASLSAEARQASAAGMVRTTWTGYFGNRSALLQYHQIYSYLPAADHFWNARGAKPSISAVGAADRFRADWLSTRERPQATSGFALDLRPVATRSHIDDGAGAGWLEKGPDYDLRHLPTGRQRMAGVLFSILDPEENRGRSVVMLRGTRGSLRALPQRVTVPVGRTAASLCFLHALPHPGTRWGDPVLTYRVHFGDGSSADVPVQYRLHIMTWLDDPITIEHEIAWEGRTRSGLDVRLSMLCWTNPTSDQQIVTVDMLAGESEAAPAVFAITGLDRPRRSEGRR
ncbi:MAG TPA: beta-N-acetylhexosaminidase [bacterium]|nr:beta-N-acetylhexosaminidase [bacterium]